jgi:hypothetical protein
MGISLSPSGAPYSQGFFDRFIAPPSGSSGRQLKALNLIVIHEFLQILSQRHGPPLFRI